MSYKTDVLKKLKEEYSWTASTDKTRWPWVKSMIQFMENHEVCVVMAVRLIAILVLERCDNNKRTTRTS